MPIDLLADSQFKALGIDWAVIAVYLVATTLVGAKLAGKQSTIRDFFLAGRKLPWWAISGSIIATEISAVTLIAVPAISAAEGGDLRYLQLAIGAVIARIIIARYFVPRFYEREIYSPYDYAGQRLGPRVKRLTTGLFMVAAMLGQGARVYITARLLQVIADMDLIASIWVMTLFSVAWTFIGGMTTVIWTDVAQFLIMAIGAIVALVCAIVVVQEPLPKMFDMAVSQHKFRVLDFSTNPSAGYTLWCGLLATPFLNLAALGTDQAMAQRMFCCRNQRDASRAVMVSIVGMGITLLMLFVGVALYVYYLHHPVSTSEALRYSTRSDDKDYALPLFLVEAVPAGIRGVIIAAILASAVSTPALAALAQGSIGVFAQARKGTARERVRSFFRNEIMLSRALIVAWGAGLALMGMACIALARLYDNSVDLALGLVGYTYGPLLGIFLLAFLGMRRDDSGLFWSVPLAMLAVFSTSVHEVFPSRLNGWPVRGGLADVDLSNWVVYIGAFAFLVAALVRRRFEVTQMAGLTAAVLLIVALHHAGPFGIMPNGDGRYIAFPWNYPIATLLTFALGWLLGRPADPAERKSATPARRRAT